MGSTRFWKVSRMKIYNPDEVLEFMKKVILECIKMYVCMMFSDVRKLNGWMP